MLTPSELWTIASTFFCFLTTFWLLKRFLCGENFNLFPESYYVVISGGSKGIGLELAKHYASLGADVCIIARDINALENARREIRACCSNRQQIISVISMDLTKKLPLSSSKLILGPHKRVDILINNCGKGIPATFEDLTDDEVRHMMDVNYFSATSLTRLVLPYMKERGGHIVFVSSMCGVLSFYGYSAYSAAKFALVGFAQALAMELSPCNIAVTVAFPSDVQTPGFDTENLRKPEITRIISESSSVFNANSVAEKIASDIRQKKFYSTLGLENEAALMAANSFMPTTWSDLIVSVVFASPIKLIAYFLIRGWYGVVKKQTT